MAGFCDFSVWERICMNNIQKENWEAERTVLICSLYCLDSTCTATIRRYYTTYNHIDFQLQTNLFLAY